MMMTPKLNNYESFLTANWIFHLDPPLQDNFQVSVGILITIYQLIKVNHQRKQNQIH